MAGPFNRGEVASPGGDAQAVIDVALAAARPEPLAPGAVYGVAVPSGGDVRLLDLTEDRYLDTPRRKTGTVTVHDADAFIAYVQKHGREGATEVWSDVPNQSLCAVLDADEADTPGWSGHRVRLVLRKTPAWEAWERIDRRLLTQRDFAEHIEDRAPDVVTPSAADMLELAETFEAHSNVEFKSTEVLAGGKRGLTFVETTTAKAGQQGQIDIPKEIRLGLRPFYGSEPYGVTARFRYKIQNGTLLLGVVLDRASDIIEAAYGDIVAKVDEGIEQSIWAGATR